MKKSSFYLLGAGFIVFSFMIGCAGSKNDKKENSVVGVPRGAGGQKPQAPENTPGGKTNPDGTAQPGGDKGGPSSTAGGNGSVTGQTACTAQISNDLEDDEKTAELKDMKADENGRWVLGKVEVFSTSGKVDSTEDEIQMMASAGTLGADVKVGKAVENLGSVSCFSIRKTGVNDISEKGVSLPYSISTKDGKVTETRADLFSIVKGKSVSSTTLEKTDKDITQLSLDSEAGTLVKVSRDTEKNRFIIRVEKSGVVDQIKTKTLIKATYGLAK